jgi:NitT/TauT family transport system permease protein
MTADLEQSPRGAKSSGPITAAPVAENSLGRNAFIFAARVVLLAVFLVLWQVASKKGWIDSSLFGWPTAIWHAMWSYLPSQRAVSSLSVTLEAVFWAFVIGGGSGLIFGLVLGLNRTLDRIFGPFLAPLNSIPRIALAPLFITWFGLTITAKVALGISLVFFIWVESARSAVRSVDLELMTMARVTGVRSIGLLAKVVLPSAVPTVFTALRLTFIYALLGVISSEMIAASSGVGQDLIYFSSNYQANTFFAILVELMLVAIIVNGVLNVAERWLLRWRRD